MRIPRSPDVGAPANGLNKYESLWYGTTAAENAGATLSVAKALVRMSDNPEPPAIVVPVYNAPAETEACLLSLLMHTSSGCRIIVIDDASPDPRIRAILNRYDGRGPIEVFHNADNLGYTRTVNRGIELAGRADVVLLNSDTQVTPGWLRNLRLAAYSSKRIGSATPFSNNAGAFSAPVVGRSNPIPGSVGLDDYARAISQVSLRAYPETPTGNGFCMYVRRDCIDATGPFDAEAFPRGYGEENDFCMRSGRLGWRHVIDDATLIYHVRSASFGKAGNGLRQRGLATIEARFPEYRGAVRKFLGSEHIKAARERIHQVVCALDAEAGVRPRVAFVISTRTGGTPQTNEDLMAALNHKIEPFVLHCDSATLMLMHFRDGSYITIRQHALQEPLRAFPHRSDEYDAVVADWLVQFAIELVHVRHIAWHGLGLVDVARGLGLPVVFSFHDFYSVCPTVNLLDERSTYCAGKCTPTDGECRYALWGDKSLPPLKHAAIKEWQKQIGEMLKMCDAFVTTSESARDTLVETYPFLRNRKFPVIVHGRDFDRFEQDAAPLEEDGTLRILIPGNLSLAKGDAVVSELAKLSRRHRIELHVMGALSSSLTPPPPNLVYHGTYRRGDFASKVKAIKPHIGGVFSIWAETYCHTLSELWASGIPAIGFDFGAIGERIRQTGAGWLACEHSAAGILEIVERLRAQPSEHARKLAAVWSWQQAGGKTNTCAHMSHMYLELYSALLPGLATKADHIAGTSARGG